MSCVSTFLQAWTVQSQTASSSTSVLSFCFSWPFSSGFWRNSRSLPVNYSAYKSARLAFMYCGWFCCCLEACWLLGYSFHSSVFHWMAPHSGGTEWLGKSVSMAAMFTYRSSHQSQSSFSQSCHRYSSLPVEFRPFHDWKDFLMRPHTSTKTNVVGGCPSISAVVQWCMWLGCHRSAKYASLGYWSSRSLYWCPTRHTSEPLKSQVFSEDKKKNGLIKTTNFSCNFQKNTDQTIPDQLAMLFNKFCVATFSTSHNFEEELNPPKGLKKCYESKKPWH